MLKGTKSEGNYNILKLHYKQQQLQVQQITIKEKHCDLCLLMKQHQAIKSMHKSHCVTLTLNPNHKHGPGTPWARCMQWARYAKWTRCTKWARCTNWTRCTQGQVYTMGLVFIMGLSETVGLSTMHSHP